MANPELLEKLEMDESGTADQLYVAVAANVNLTIDGITEAMRGRVLRVRSIARGSSFDAQRTNVRIGGIRHLPLTQEKLLTRWADVGQQRYGTAGVLQRTHEISAGNALLQHYGLTSNIRVKGLGEDNQSQDLWVEPSVPLQEMEPSRRTLLLNAAGTIIRHTDAIQQINSGVPAAAVLAALHNPEHVVLIHVDQ